jgi:hypothetical protein
MAGGTASAYMVGLLAAYSGNDHCAGGVVGKVASPFAPGFVCLALATVDLAFFVCLLLEANEGGLVCAVVQSVCRVERQKAR